jgi:zinc protease
MAARQAFIGILAAGTLSAGAAAAPVAPVSDWKQIRKPALRAFRPVQPKRVVFGNGMVVFIQEDRELPLVQATLRIRGGSREEDPAKVGLVSIYGQSWRTGGTKKRTGDQLDDFLAGRAASVETGGGLDSTTVGFNCLKENLDEVFAAFLEVLQEPEFRQDKIDLAKRQLSAGISRRNDNPQSIVFREARKVGFGAASPYARHVEYATIGAVTREDMLAWHKTYVHPGNMILGVVGDFDGAAMEVRLRKAFASLPKGTPAKRVRGDRPPGGKPGYYLVEKDDVNQTNICMVHLGTTNDTPDYHAIQVANEVVGAGFWGRLFSSVRTRKGLAYAVAGAIGADYDHPGLTFMWTSTKSETTAAAIDALYEEVDRLKKEPVTAEELQRAKDAILNSFVFRVDSRAKVLSEKMTYEFYGYPLDFLETFQAGIEKVTAADATRVAAQYILKEKLAVVVVGKPSDFDRPLTSFGTVTPVDIKIPPPPGAAKK